MDSDGFDMQTMPCDDCHLKYVPYNKAPFSNCGKTAKQSCFLDSVSSPQLLVDVWKSRSI